MKKQIPAEAGLAGGSSNAAGMLKLLKNWYLKSLGGNKSLDRHISRIARELGSDVDFFLHDSPAARCSGRGEQCKPTKLPAWWNVLVHPQQGISTAEAYRELSKSRPKKMGFDLSPPQWMGQTREFVPALQNDFEAWALSRYPKLDQLQRDLCRSGAIAGAMSGIGSSFYGIYRSESSAQQAKSFLDSKSWKSQVCQILESSNF